MIFGASIDIEKNYLMVVELDEKLFGLGCGEIFGIENGLSRGEVVLSLEKILDRG